jgi:hypothetical protein
VLDVAYGFLGFKVPEVPVVAEPPSTSPTGPVGSPAAG